MNTDLVRAIREKRLIEFTYKSGGVRIAEPHDYGIQNGIERLLTFQLAAKAARVLNAVGGTSTSQTFVTCAFWNSDLPARAAIAIRSTVLGMCCLHVSADQTAPRYCISCLLSYPRRRCHRRRRR